MPNKKNYPESKSPDPSATEAPSTVKPVCAGCGGSGRRLVEDRRKMTFYVTCECQSGRKAPV